MQLKDKIFPFLANFQGVGVQFSNLTSSKVYLGVKIYIHWKAETLDFSYLPKKCNENILLVVHGAFETKKLNKTEILQN